MKNDLKDYAQEEEPATIGEIAGYVIAAGIFCYLLYLLEQFVVMLMK